MKTEKVNICIFVRSLLRGGAEKQSILLADYLKRFFEVNLVVLYPSTELLNFARSRSVNVITLRGRVLLKAVKFYLFLRRKHIDTLFCYLPSNNIIGGVVGKAAGVKRIFGGLRGVKLKKSRIKMAAQKFVCNHISDVFIANSEAGRERYIAYGYDPSKVVVIPNMADINDIPNKSGTTQNDATVTITSVGRFVHEKDYNTALKAMEIIKHSDQKGKFRYLIVGYSPLKPEIIQNIKDRDIEDCVEIIEGNAPGAVARNLKQADIFLITSKFEGMPNAVMEAMMYALPVVATNAGDVHKLVISGENGFVCEIGDFSDIAKRILYLINNWKIRQEMGAMGYNRIREEFSMEQVGRLYMDLLRRYI